MVAWSGCTEILGAERMDSTVDGTVRKMGEGHPMETLVPILGVNIRSSYIVRVYEKHLIYEMK
jgi:hypothetical protein